MRGQGRHDDAGWKAHGDDHGRGRRVRARTDPRAVRGGDRAARSSAARQCSMPARGARSPSPMPMARRWLCSRSSTKSARRRSGGRCSSSPPPGRVTRAHPGQGPLIGSQSQKDWDPAQPHVYFAFQITVSPKISEGFPEHHRPMSQQTFKHREGHGGQHLHDRCQPACGLENERRAVSGPRRGRRDQSVISDPITISLTQTAASPMLASLGISMTSPSWPNKAVMVALGDQPDALGAIFDVLGHGDAASTTS